MLKMYMPSTCTRCVPFLLTKFLFNLVDIPSNELPVDVHLEAFNPCIPHNTKDSAIPMIIFNYTVKNPTDKKLKVICL